MRKTIIYLIVLVALLTSCIEEFDLDVSNLGKKYSVDAIVSTDSSLNYVRLSHFNQNNVNSNFSNPGVEYLMDTVAVKGAQVFIVDQNNDTTAFHELTSQEFLFKYGSGYYAPSGDFIGKVGYKYRLVVEIDNEIITSESQIVKGAQIEKMEVVSKKLEIQKDEAYVPQITFRDPDTEKTNYYITNIYEKNYGGFTGSNRNWSYAIFDDSLLDDYVENFSVSSGTSPSNKAWYPHSDDGIQVRLMTVTKEVYEFYNALISQIENQGGVFSQSPGSHSSNIKGNAEGCFVCADVSFSE
jgi:hypothetical protein